MSFLDGYEDVNARITRFRSEFPSGKLIASIEDKDLAAGWVLVKAEAYKEYEDIHPSAVDFAYGNVATLQQNMRKWLVEDTTTSAIGRVIGLLTPSEARPTRQDMERVEQLPASSDPWQLKTVNETGTTSLSTALELVKSELQGEAVPQGPVVCRHGSMVMKRGISKTTGNKYEGWTCPSSNRDDQCKPVWL